MTGVMKGWLGSEQAKNGVRVDYAPIIASLAMGERREQVGRI